MFREAYKCEDNLGVICNKDYVVLRWSEAPIFISFSQKGKESINMHFSSAKQGLRYIKNAVNEFCEWIFSIMEDCEMIFAIINKPSVERITGACGFYFLTSDNKYKVYARYK